MQPKAYIAILSIILLLGVAAYSANKSINDATEPIDQVKSQDAPNDGGSDAKNQPSSNSSEFIPDSYIILINQHNISPSSITVLKGHQIDLIIKADRNFSGGGITAKSSLTSSASVAPGASNTVTFTAQESFVMEFYGDNGERLSYILPVIVK